jgi:spermidine/putrescine transport system ATP-binding protein
VSSVEAKGVTKIFGQGTDQEVVALDDATIAIRDNEFFTLLGPSGCGKTTLLRLIAGFEQPTRGEILIAGEPMSGRPPYRRPVNTVFQSYALFPHMSVEENIAFGLEMQGFAKTDITSRVAEMVSLVRLDGLERRRPAQLSGGQQQRVALARALANRPKVLLLDEPLSALDLKLRKDMQIELKRIQNETGLTFVFVTHDQSEALTMSDRIAVMDNGRILQVGTATEIYEHPSSHFVADFIGETNFLKGEVVSLENGEARVRLSSGAERLAVVPEGTSPRGEVSLSVRPERASLRAETAEAALTAHVDTVIYVGSDTQYRLGLEDGSRFQIRLQNSGGAVAAHATGDQVGIEIPDGALQVLRD